MKSHDKSSGQKPAPSASQEPSKAKTEPKEPEEPVSSLQFALVLVVNRNFVLFA